MKRAATLLVTTILAVSSAVHAQGYFIDTTLVLPTQAFRSQVFPIALSLVREDAQSIGMGRSQIANARPGAQMLANPALLASPRTAVDLLNIQAGIPGQTLTAVDFLKTNSIQFQQGLFLKEIQGGLEDFSNATTSEQYLAAIHRMNGGLKFIDDLFSSVSGGQENPITHGLRIVPMVQAQLGNFGVSVFATAQTGFQVASGQSLQDLKGFRIPENLSDVAAVRNAVQSLLLAVGALFDPSGDVAADALPSIFAVSYVDIIGSVGYGMHLAPNLDGGVALKIINRRFSTSHIAAGDLGSLFTETRKNFQANTTGVTADAGLLYTLPASHTRLAVTAENILPVKTIESDVSIDFVGTGILGYARTSYPSGPIKVVGTDTGLVAARVPIHAVLPFELKAPFILTAGAQHPLTPEWDVTAEWTDIGAQSNIYTGFAERIRFGTEYRIRLLSNSVGLAGRLGFAQDHATYGIGLSLFRVLTIDGAAAFDTFTSATSYYAQLRIGL